MKNILIPSLCLAILSILINESSAVPLEPNIETNICALDIDEGSCGGDIPFWGFDTERRECVIFNFGGCGGNRNRFLTKKACETKCSEKKMCAIEWVDGPCPAIFRVWGYDPAKRQCVQYNYGGCGGLEHRFRTREACERFC